MSTHKHLCAGIDVGSSAVKVAISRSNAGQDGEMLILEMQRIRRRSVLDVVGSTLQMALEKAGVSGDDFDYIATTGDADHVEIATGHFYGMTTHARGAVYLDPSARAALDIGALHARAMRINEVGRVLQHRMTSQCASGSGQFLENIARYLGVPLEEVGKLSQEADDPEECSSICAVLAETDVINMVSRNISTANIVKGIHLSIGKRLAGLLRAVKADGTVMVTGGLAHDLGQVEALRELLDAASKKASKRRKIEVNVVAHEKAIYAGAIGASLLAAFRHQQLEDKNAA